MQRRIYRRFIRVIGATVGLGLWGLLSVFQASGQQLPTRITWIVPFGLGGGTGTSALVLGPRLKDKLAKFGVKEVNVISVPGAGGTIGVKRLYNSTADGSVIGSMLPAGALAQMAVRDVGFDLSRFTYLGRISTMPRVVFVKGDSPFRSFQDLIAEGHKRQIRFSSTGPAAADSFTLANVIDKTGIQAKAVTGYKGGRELVVAVARGDVDATVKTTGGVVTFIKSGEVRGLIQFSSVQDKDPSFPDIPSVEEIGRKDLLPGGLLYIIVAAPPKLPEALAKVFRTAVHETVMESKKDIIEKAQVVYSPATGEETTELVSGLIRDFADLAEIYKKQQK